MVSLTPDRPRFQLILLSLLEQAGVGAVAVPPTLETI